MAFVDVLFAPNNSPSCPAGFAMVTFHLSEKKVYQIDCRLGAFAKTSIISTDSTGCFSLWLSDHVPALKLMPCPRRLPSKRQELGALQEKGPLLGHGCSSGGTSRHRRANESTAGQHLHSSYCIIAVVTLLLLDWP